ncbi:chorismate synthase [Nitrososphaera sp. AFS]|jgi:chorismate synthase|uniref:chorismate synthase n=1 Tax=Nitrososphaera sp. AFS TaxID=2301191 RepID=UPI0013922E70|nr:chorismate synthase [Nitrososphaera sp. AFS]NAL77095.1 chorismate synthase [Nitrososphaera sp. AFS]
MPGNTLGERFVTMSFGESHGRCLGMVLDGCPAGLPLQESDIQPQLDRRRPGTSVVTTQRKEQDKVDIISGTYNGFTTGAPICAILWNQDQNSAHYELIKSNPRPGHADYPAMIKYGGFTDHRGGGRFSGRLTATLVMAGSIAQKLLGYSLGVETTAYTTAIGDIRAEQVDLITAKKNRYTNDVRCPDVAKAEEMKSAIMRAKKVGDSLGGIVECITTGVPVGIGEPIFSSLESDLSKALFSIPAVKAVEFGSGFNGTRMRGSENNDPYFKQNDKIVTTTNNSGGILGGLSNGMPIELRVGFKPASSIAKTQKTINLITGEQTDLSVPGRHDPCVVPRAPPIVECVVSMVLADLALRGGFIPPILRR